MKDILPTEVLDAIRDHFVRAVVDAERGFRFSSGDEDSLTGALGQSLVRQGVRILTVQGEFAYAVTYYKVRGRGRDAPEKRTGADGIFQVEVRDGEGHLVRSKGLPFQAKKNWNQRDSNLNSQADNMIREFGTGLVIDYSAAGYLGCPAEDVVLAEGSRRKLSRKRRLAPLGSLLGDDFLECTIGLKGLYYDSEREEFVRPGAEPIDSVGQLHVVHARIRKSF